MNSELTPKIADALEAVIKLIFAERIFMPDKEEAVEPTQELVFSVFEKLRAYGIVLTEEQDL